MTGAQVATFRDPAREERFARDGYVVMPFFTDADLAHFRRRFDELYPARRRDFETTALNEADDPHHLEAHHELVAWFQDRVDEQLDRQEIRHAYYMCKRAGGPGDRSEVVLHQDWTYVPEPEVRGPLMWCPLVDVDERNGWLQVVPGSHRFLDEPRGTGEMPWAYEQVEDRLRAALVSLPLRAGEIVVYDGALIHCSPPNRTDADRPVVGLGLAPAGAPMVHFHSPDGQVLERFEVTDDFYVEEELGGRPVRGYRSVSTAPYDPPRVTEAQLDRWLHGGRPPTPVGRLRRRLAGRRRTVG